MTPYFSDGTVELHHGDCLDVLRELPDSSVDAVVTDPPYGISFMGREWDQPDQYGSQRRGGSDRSFKADPTGVDHLTTIERSASMHAGKYDLSRSAMLSFHLWCTEWTTECLRILKPGGHLLSFGGSRTWHRLAAAVEDAGFEIRDSIAWLYAQGFPKSMNVNKDARFCRCDLGESDHDGDVLGVRRGVSAPGESRVEGEVSDLLTTVPVEPGVVSVERGSQAWRGWPVCERCAQPVIPAGLGTALKPAFEPIVVARKPLTGTVAANVQEYGTGALNIDACRTAAGQDYAEKCASVVGLGSNRNGDAYGEWTGVREDSTHAAGRWPTNVVLDESQAAELDKQTPVTSNARPDMVTHTKAVSGANGVYGKDARERHTMRHGDTGGASRFFPVFRYQAKAPAKERPKVDGIAHPTVKPLELMRWLVRLVTPPGGLVLDLFAGSGTTGEACALEGLRCLLIEREADYLPLILDRLTKTTQLGLDFDEAKP